jgi:hypothetical protein
MRAAAMSSEDQGVTTLAAAFSRKVNIIEEPSSFSFSFELKDDDSGAHYLSNAAATKKKKKKNKKKKKKSNKLIIDEDDTCDVDTDQAPTIMIPSLSLASQSPPPTLITCTDQQIQCRPLSKGVAARLARPSHDFLSRPRAV